MDPRRLSSRGEPAPPRGGPWGCPVMGPRLCEKSARSRGARTKFSRKRFSGVNRKSRNQEQTGAIDPLQTLALRCYGRPRSITKD